MKKKVLSILLALCLVLTLLPSVAQAVAIYRLYVGNTLVFDYTSSSPESTWETGTTYYWKAAGSGDYAYTQTGNANDYLFSVNFDEGIESFTLTLNGVNITTTDSSGHGIYSNSSLNIVLVDDSSNYVSSSGDAIYVSQNVGISGSGSLTVTAGTSSSGIYSPYSNIIIEGGTVTANGNTGISASQGSITISGGSVTAGGKGNGIWASGNFTVSGGSAKVTATNTYGQSIYTSGSVSVTANPYKYRTNTSATEPDTNYTLYPSTAFANSDSYKYIEIISCPEVYVSGDNTNSGTVLVSSVTGSGNISYWLNDGSGSITNTGASAESYNVKYDEATQTLTLKDANITSFHSVNRMGIYARGVALSIVLEGDSVIGTTETPIRSYGIYCGSLSISSDTGGSLSITGSPGSYSGIKTYDGDVSISGATVSFTSFDHGIDAAGEFSLADGTVSVTSGEDGIKAYGDIAVTGAQTELNVIACTSISFGCGVISSDGGVSIDDAEVRVETLCDNGDAVWAYNDIRISGSADIAIVDWSTYDDVGCGLHSYDGNVAIGGSSQVDICSQNIGIYANNNVYLGYVWNGIAYAASGSPTVAINSAGSVAAITPETDNDFHIGENGIKASSGGISMSGGTLTAVGSTNALSYAEGNSVALPSSYKYKSNTEASAPEGSYIYGTYTYSENDKYLEIAATHSVTKAAAENGSFTVMVSGVEVESAAEGDTVTLTAAPASGYIFSSWSVYRTDNPGTAVSISGNSFTMPAYAVTVEAVFIEEPAATYTITKEAAENGSFTVSVGGTEVENAAEGDTVTLTAAPASGYIFSSWSVYRTDNPGTAVSVSGNSFTMPAYAVTVEAVFIEEPAATYAITKALDENGSFTVSVGGAEASCAAAGDTVTLTAVPASGYTHSSWSVYRTGDTSTVVSVSGNTFTMPAYAVTVEAVFTSAGGSGGGITPRTITVTETSSGLFSGTQGTVRAEANMTSAFSNSVEVKVKDTTESASNFGLGAGNNVYPFDISLYIKGTNTKTEPMDGYAVTISLPIPDFLLDVKEHLSIAHKADDGTVTTLASQLKQINGIWYLVFEATEFSPYALVVNSIGTYDETAGLPYYMGAKGNRVFIGFAANGKYITPEGVTISVIRNDKSFTDVSGHWAASYIAFTAERELFLGTGANAFSPDSGMTRAMFATVIGRLYERSYGEIETMSTHVFTDCDYGDYYGKYVDWAAENGILDGYWNGEFGPDDPVTREQMAAILYRFADFLGVLPDDMDTALSYPDAGTISSYAESAALYCQSTGIITGRDGGSFVPQGTATRAEVAVILERFIENILG